MSNHVHLLARAKDENLSDILRDFKKFTSKQIIKAIEQNEKESRREWMLRIFKEQGEKNSRNKDYQFWRQDNQPKECYSPKFSLQKLAYIHNNPVESGLDSPPGSSHRAPCAIHNLPQKQLQTPSYFHQSPGHFFP
jgi:putative transposase